MPCYRAGATRDNAPLPPLQQIDGCSSQPKFGIQKYALCHGKFQYGMSQRLEIWVLILQASWQVCLNVVQWFVTNSLRHSGWFQGNSRALVNWHFLRLFNVGWRWIDVKSVNSLRIVLKIENLFSAVHVMCLCWVDCTTKALYSEFAFIYADST